MDRSDEGTGTLPSGLQLTLTVVHGPDKGKTTVIDRPELIVGRGKVDFQLQDRAVSSRHFAVKITDGEAQLRDLGTTNGTIVNGERNDNVVLISKDEIEVGESRIVFQVRSTSPTAGPPPGPEPPPADDAVAARMAALKAQLEGVAPGETVKDASSDSQAKVGVVRPDTAVFLEILDGADAGKTFDLSQPGIYLIGREKGEIPLQDQKCSTKHAQIQVLGEQLYFLSDLASTNGTFLNEIRTERRRLKHMDIVRIGETRLRFSCMSGTIPLSR